MLWRKQIMDDNSNNQSHLQEKKDSCCALASLVNLPAIPCGTAPIGHEVAPLPPSKRRDIVRGGEGYIVPARLISPINSKSKTETRI
jgi:hypothetical protein